MLNKLKKINYKQKLVVASFTQKIMDGQARKMCKVARIIKKGRTDESLQRGQRNSWLYNNSNKYIGKYTSSVTSDGID